MREIKFRVWIEKEKRMGSWEILKKECNRLSILEFKGFIPMQYIGLRDYTEQMIYEGDIVDVTMGHDGKTLPHRGEIVYSDEFGAFATKNLAGETLLHNHCLHTLKVVGNIYNNPELAKELKP